MAALSRSDLSLEPGLVKLDDGREFLVRRFNALERADYSGVCAEASVAVKDGNAGARLRAARILQGDLLFRTVLNADGSPMFTSGEDAASAMDEGTLDAMTDKVAKLNRLGPVDPNA